MGFSKDFLWGGATAANQYEGGVFEGGAGLATADVMTNGSHTVRRQVTWKKEDGTTGSTPLCVGSEERHLPEGAIPCLLEDEKYYYVTAGLIHADEQNIANATFHQFLASAKTVIAAHQSHPEIRVGMMLAFGPVYGYTCDPYDQLLAKQQEDRTLFYSDVQMPGVYPTSKLKEYARKNI